MSDEDDWFERALRDSDADSDAAEGDEDDETGESNEDDETANGDEPPAREASDPGEATTARTSAEATRSAESGTASGIRRERPGTTSMRTTSPETYSAVPSLRVTRRKATCRRETIRSAGESFGGDDPFGGGSFGEEDPFGDESANDGTPDPTGSGGDSAAGCSGTTIPLTAGQRAADQRAAGQRAVSPLTADRQTPSAGIGERRRRLQWAERCRIR